jgi:hypothetical protein
MELQGRILFFPGCFWYNSSDEEDELCIEWMRKQSFT